MKSVPWHVAFCLLIGVAVAGCGRPEPKPDRLWRDFVLDLKDRGALARVDRRSSKLISSYDRSGGNDDFNYFAGQGSEKGWVVMADLKGPGVVRRFWMTGVDFGHPVRIYIDGERKARIGAKVEELFGETYPFIRPLAHYMNTCWWTYVPLTYNKSLRIETLAPPVNPYWGPRRLFFQVNYEDLDGMTVESFPRKLDEGARKAVTEVCDAWQQALNWPDPDFGGETARVIPAGGSLELWRADGPGVVQEWFIEAAPAGTQAWTVVEREAINQQLVVEVCYDGLAAPSISAPLGDLFCNGARGRHFGGMLLGRSPAGDRFGLPMPYRQGCVIRAVNEASKDISVRFRAVVEGVPEETAGYLHVAWSKSGPESGAAHTVLKGEGRGKLVGCYLESMSVDKSWWLLEGDETMVVDGEFAPSWHGTGLEDYFNGGWYYRGAGFGAFNGVMDKRPFVTSQYRFHLVDPVRFDRSLVMQFERGDRNVSHGFMRSAAYYYLDAPRGVPSCLGQPEKRKAEANPFEEFFLMFQIQELERMNDFASAKSLLEEWIEVFPGKEDDGVLRLRILEYRRLLGDVVAGPEYQPFLEGAHGPQAQAEARALQWFYANPNRALVGACINGNARVYVDGREVLAGDLPLNLGVAGIELGPGRHVVAAEVEHVRPEAWVQIGVRTHSGLAGTGPGMKQAPEAPPDWMSPDNRCEERWLETTPAHTMSGPPHGLSMPKSRPNAFVLIPSKTRPMCLADWDYFRCKGYFKFEFVVPLEGMPDFSKGMVGLNDDVHPGGRWKAGPGS